MTTIIESDFLLNERKLVLITHDESNFYANDSKRLVLIEPPKDSWHINYDGWVHLQVSDSELNFKSYFKAGKSREG